MAGKGGNNLYFITKKSQITPYFVANNDTFTHDFVINIQPVKVMLIGITTKIEDVG